MDLPGNLTVGRLVEQRAEHFGDREYLVFEDAGGAVQVLTYSDLELRTNAVANSLVAQGLTRGDRVLVMLRNSVEFVVAILAAAKMGAVSVPVNTASVGPDLRHVLNLVEPRATIAHVDYADLVAGEAALVGTVVLAAVVGEPVGGSARSEARRAAVPWDRLAQGDPGAVPHDGSSDDLLQLLMTSGTTARPKAVMHTHANRIRSGYRVTATCRLFPEDRSLSAFPAFHVNCLDGTLFAALVSGGTAVLLEEFSARRFWDQVTHHRATIVPLLPTVIRALLARPPSAADREHSVRYVGTGLHLSSEELEQFAQRYGIPAITTGYGLTEASTGVLSTLQEGDQHYPSIGMPLLDRMVELVDENDAPVEVGQTGEIVVQGTPGRTVMLGYYGDPEATKEALREGWLHTGDLAQRDADGYFYFMGRSKDMIKRSGENVAAQEVEVAVLEHEAVLEVAVVGAPDPFRDEAVKAFVILRPGASLELDALKAHCASRLADFKIPTLLEVVDDLPRGLLGKVDKKVLRAREQAIAAERSTEVRTSSDTTRRSAREGVST